MPRPDGRLEPGQPLRGAISARAWNRAQDAADLVLGAHAGAAGFASSGGHKPYTWVRFIAPQDTNVGDILSLDTTADVYIPTSFSDAASVLDQIVLFPRVADYNTFNFGVSVDCVKNGEIGRMAISGVVPCRVTLPDASYRTWTQYVIPSNNPTRLTAAMYGNARILALLNLVSSSGGLTYNAIINLGQRGGDVQFVQWDGSWSGSTKRSVTLRQQKTTAPYTFDDVYNLLGDLQSPYQTGVIVRNDVAQGYSRWTLVSVEPRLYLSVTKSGSNVTGVTLTSLGSPAGT